MNSHAQWAIDDSKETFYKSILDLLRFYEGLNKFVYKIETESKLDFEIFEKDLVLDDEGAFILNDKIKKLKELYSHDLFLLNDLLEINFVIVIPKLIKNKFSFDLIMSFEFNYKDGINLEQDLIKFIKNILIFKSCEPIKFVNLNFYSLIFNDEDDFDEKYLSSFIEQNQIFIEKSFVKKEYSQWFPTGNISLYDLKKIKFNKLCSHIIKKDNFHKNLWYGILDIYIREFIPIMY